MKAIEINGKIKIYNKLPKSWDKVIGGFDLLSNDELKSYGFYSVVIPDYDSRVEKLGDIYFDADNEIFKRDKENLTWIQTLAELKENKINNLQHYTNSELAKTDWYYIRQLHRGINVPQEIDDERTAIIVSHNEHETAINALTKKADVEKYEFR